MFYTWLLPTYMISNKIFNMYECGFQVILRLRDKVKNSEFIKVKQLKLNTYKL